MVVCGPFTVNNELSYEALKDVIANVQKDKPHTLIMTGPFINQNHEDVASGIMKYRDQSSGKLEFLDYQGLFREIMDYIYGSIDKNTKIIVVPSFNEIQHAFPLPQPSMGPSFF